MKVLLIVFIFILTASCFKKSALVSDYRVYPEDGFQCLKENNYEEIVVATVLESTYIQNTIETLTQAKKNLFYSDIFIFLYRDRPFEEQMKLIFTSIPPQLYGMVWVYMIRHELDTNSTENCLNLKKIVSIIKSYGKKPGIVGSKSIYDYYFFKSDCNELGS